MAPAPEPEPEPHPLAGSWAYIVVTPQGDFTGTLNFTQEGDSLMAAISSDDSPGETISFVANFDEETQEVSFSFDAGEFGMMDVSMTLAGGALAGEQYARDYSMSVDITATRVEESESQ